MSKRRSPLDKVFRNIGDRERRAKRAEEPAFTDEADMRAKVTLTQAELAAWNQIAAGRPMRNSTAVLAAIKMKMEFTMSKPAQKVDADQRLQIEIVNVGATPDVAPPYTPGKNKAVEPPVEAPDAQQE